MGAGIGMGVDVPLRDECYPDHKANAYVHYCIVLYLIVFKSNTNHLKNIPNTQPESKFNASLSLITFFVSNSNTNMWF